MVETSVVIIGAGPAGVSCAYILRQAGVNCSLVDFASFPRDKVCGGGLTPKAYRLLAELMPDLQYEYRALSKVKFSVYNKRIGEMKLPNEIRIVSRKEFDFALLRQYLNAGGEFIQDAFSGFENQPDGRILVRLKSGDKLLCNYLVGADGANSRVRRQILGKYNGNVLCMEQRVTGASDAIEGVVSKEYKDGYFYLFPSLGYDVIGLGYSNLTLKGFRDMLAKYGVEETKIMGADISVREVDSGMDNVMLIGDAGGFANKISYEGLYYAIATGRNAAEAIIDGRPFKETNRDILRRKWKERLLFGVYYSGFGRMIARVCAGLPGLVRRIFVSVLEE